jgi:hypothetical protein
MKLKDAHTAYIPSRDEIGTFDVDPVTKKPGPFVTRTDEILLAASGWVLRASAGNLEKNLPPVLRWLKKLVRSRKVGDAKRVVEFHDGVRIEFTVRVTSVGRA